MKKILFGLLMLISFSAIAQGPPTGTYTPISGGFNWGRGYFRALNLPVLVDPAFAPNQWQGQGAIIYDSTGGNKGIHVWNGTTWIRMIDTTMTNFLISTLTASNGITRTGDDLRLGGTGTMNTTTTWGAFTQTNSWSNIGTGTMFTLNGTGTAVGGNGTLFKVSLTGTGPPAFPTYAAIIENAKTTASSLNTGLKVRSVRGSTEGGRVALWADSGRVVVGTPNGVDPGTGADFHFYANGMGLEDSYYHGMTMENSTAATALVPAQVSPDFTWFSQRWNTDSSYSEPVYITAHLLPESGADSSAGILKIEGYVGYGTDDVGMIGFGTKGTIHVGNSLDPGTEGKVLTSHGDDDPPTWETPTGGGGGVTTLAAIGSTPNANGATISGSTLNLEPANGSFGGVVTTGSQTFAGLKAFGGDINLTNTNPSIQFSGSVRLQDFGSTFRLSGPGGLVDLFSSGSSGLFKVYSPSALSSINVQGTATDLVELYSLGTNNLAIQNGSGLLTGIGTATPSEKLDVAGNIRFSGALMPNNAAGSSGQVLTSVGAGSPPTWTNYTLQNALTAGSTLTGDNTITGGNNTLQVNYGANGSFFALYGASTGGYSIGSTSSFSSSNQVTSQATHISGQPSYHRIFTTNGTTTSQQYIYSDSISLSSPLVRIGGAVRMSSFGAGTATFDASGNISSVSDGRLKNIVRNYKAGLKEIMKLNPIVYTWKKGSGMETRHQYAGLDAREVYKVFGDLGSGENGEGYRTVQDRALIAALINAVKELKAEIEELKKHK